jgi:hypothetical protein
MNSPTRYGGGSGYFNGEQLEGNQTAALVLILFFVLFFAISVASKDMTDPVVDENGCYPKGRIGLYCPPD